MTALVTTKMAEKGSNFAKKLRIRTDGDDSSDNGEKRPVIMAETESMLADVEYYTDKLIYQST